MDIQSVLHSTSRKPTLFIAVGATCYLALNAVLIHEIVEQVRSVPRAATATPAYYQAKSLEPRGPSASCAELARVDRDICKGELLLDKATARWKQRRTAYDDRSAKRAPATLPREVHGESLATAR